MFRRAVDDLDHVNTRIKLLPDTNANVVHVDFGASRINKLAA